MIRALIAGYLLGAVPFAVLFGLLRRKNLLVLGSKNPGALNAIRVLGPVPGLMVLSLDLAKGFLAVAFGEAYGGVAGALAAGAAAVWGHAYSPFLLFRGGKGIAPAVGAALAVDPRLVALAFGVFLIFWAATRSPYRSALLSAALFPLVAFGYAGRLDLALFALLAVAPIVHRHLKDWHR